MNYKDLLNSIRKEFPDKAIDIAEGLELLNMIIDDTIESVGLKVNDVFSEKEYDKIPYYSNIAEKLGNYEEKIEKIIEMLDVDDSFIEVRKENEIINYDKYLVDKNIEYSLYEDFTHKKPYAFRLLDGKCIKSKTWKEILIKTCEILIEFDEAKLINFENLEHMNGRKKQYFSKEAKGMISPKKISNKIYVETNLSANAIRNLLIKILKEYDLKITDLKIYLRADYTELNKG